MKLQSRRHTNLLSAQFSREVNSLVPRKQATSSQQTIEQIYGQTGVAQNTTVAPSTKVGRYRTLRRDKDTLGSQDLVGHDTFKSSKIDNSFNNIVSNYTDVEHHRRVPQLPHSKELFNSTTQPSSQNTKHLIAERRSKDSSASSSKYASLQPMAAKRSSQLIEISKSKASNNSRSGIQDVSSSVIIKSKVTSLQKARISTKPNNNTNNSNSRKNHHKINSSSTSKNRVLEKAVTLDRYQRAVSRQVSRPPPQDANNNQQEQRLRDVIDSFVSNFQRVLNEPINLQTFQTKQMRLARKCKEAAAGMLLRVFKSRLRDSFKSMAAIGFQ